MRKTYNYFTENDGSSIEIDSMNATQLGRAIKFTYDRLKGQFHILCKLHARLGEVRPSKKTPDTKKKVLKLLKIKSLPSENEKRLEQVIETAIVLMDSEKDYEFVKKVLEQGIKND
tara:strand:+ start:485 stop:832 length:348 start_codon:yes stop_codon:yes gene_type:complete